MRSTPILLSVLVTTLAAGVAPAAELAPAEGHSIRLDNVVGTAYYTVEKDGYQVVATVASGEEATPVRFIVTLAAGQRAVLSVPRGVGQRAQELEIRRTADRVFVNEGGLLSSLGQ